MITDGERIFRLGRPRYWRDGYSDWKIVALYRVWGISPAYTLPLPSMSGHNNQQLLNDPIYMGWNQPRISGDEYYAFVDEVIAAIKRRWPKALIQFEDFAQNNAMPLLNKYRDEICCFNDDIQGTAAVLWAV